MSYSELNSGGPSFASSNTVLIYLRVSSRGISLRVRNSFSLRKDGSDLKSRCCRSPAPSVRAMAKVAASP